MHGATIKISGESTSCTVQQ